MSEALSAQAIKEIERLVLAGHTARTLTLEQEPAGRYAIVRPGGEILVEWAEPEPIADLMRSPESFVQYAKSLAIREDPDDSTARIYFDGSRLVLIHDIDSRRDRTVCDLIPSPQFSWLVNGSKQTYRQADFIRLLRIDLQGALPAASNLLPLIRELKFNNNAAAQSNIQHGKESLGRQIEAAVHGIDAIPEEVTLSVPLWENFTCIVPIRCAVEILPHEQQFKLTPFPLELRKAVELGMGSIRNLMDDTGVDYYYGSPG